MALSSEQYKNLSKKEFTKAAEKYEGSNAGVYELCKNDYPEILEEMEKENFETVLDAGCGPAPMLTLLSEKYPDKHYTGIDLTEKMIEVAKRKNLKNTELVVGDCENLPFPDNSFDIIICANSAHHYPEIEKFYESVYRCLKPNGRVIIRDLTVDSKFARFLVEKIEMPLLPKIGHGDVRMLRREDVAAGFEKAGLKIETNEKRKKMRLHIVARKPSEA